MDFWDRVIIPIAWIVIITGVVLMYFGQTNLGGIVIGVSLISLISYFIIRMLFNNG